MVDRDAFTVVCLGCMLRECDVNAGVGTRVGVTEWHEDVGGTRGSGIVSSAADVLEMSVVRGLKGVGGVCKMCMARGGVEVEWIRGLGLGFINPVVTGGVLDV